MDPMLPYRKDLKTIARKLRASATFPERLLWSKLRRKQLGARFVRQRPVGGYVVDFFSPDAHLVVELDGRSHSDRFEADMARQRFLEAHGLYVLRFSNDEVLNDLDGVVAKIVAWLETHSPLP